MTSSLPNFAASPATPAGPVSPNSATLASLLAPSGTPAATSTPAGDILLEFAALLPKSGGTEAVASVVPAPVATTTTTPVGIAAPLAGVATLPEGAMSSGCRPVAAPPETPSVPCQVFISPGRTISAVASTHVMPAKGVAPTHAPTRPHGISREEFEQAAAFVAALMQVLQPPAVPVPAPVPDTGAAGPETPVAPMPAQAVCLAPQGIATPAPAIAQGAGTPVSGSDALPTQANAVLPNGRAFPSRMTDTAKPLSGQFGTAPGNSTEPVVAEEDVVAEQPILTLTLPNGRDFPTQLPDQAKPSLGQGRLIPLDLPIQARPHVTAERPVPTDTVSGTVPPAEAPAASGVEAVAVTPTPSDPVFTLAADGAIELKLDFSGSQESDAETAFHPEGTMEVCAELELPGQAVIRVEATVPESFEFTDPAPAVNFAGLKAAEKSHRQIAADTFERNFVFTGDKEVKATSPESGITVAKSESTMSVVPTEETRAPRNPETFSALPLRADFQVVQSPAERITVAPTEPAGQNFAERAVATITGLAEAQFSASMHKAGSVQLRLKFGGEDLSVRVELRDGAVHTDFRTDSPELRAALTKEWQAVAASAPGQLQRFLDPVFSPASPSSSTEAGSQHHAFHRQSSQQQANEQAAARQDAWHSQSPFSRRSALSESFVPALATPRVPVLLPTSLRLSVLA